MPDQLARRIEAAGRPRVLVVGDLILDRYVWGEASRVSPEGPIPILRVTSEETRPGGAGNVATALAHLGAGVTVCGVVGKDAEGGALSGQLRKMCACSDRIVADGGRPTTVKTRYIGYVQSARRGIQHILRVDRETTDAVSGEIEEALLSGLEGAVGEQDAVVVSDYDKGTLTERVVGRVTALARERGVPVVTDPKIGRHYSIYRGSTVLTPNRYETQLATGIAPRDAASLQRAAAAIMDLAEPRYVVITLDRDGMYLYGEGEPGTVIPTRPREVYDVTGAGDVVVSAIAFVLATGGSVRDGVTVANAAAGIAVGKIGAAPVSREEIVADLLGLGGGNRKLRSLAGAAELAQEVRRRNGSVVWTNGCFDILHVGHYEYLKFSRQQGDVLMVGLNSDASVRRLKGPGRPITGEAERARILAALDVVDCIVIFDEDTPLRAIETIRPDVIVKGRDYRKEEVVGGEFVESYGGNVVLAPIVEGISTTDIVQKILERYAGDGGG